MKSEDSRDRKRRWLKGVGIAVMCLACFATAALLLMSWLGAKILPYMTWGDEVADDVTFERYEAEYNEAVALLQGAQGTSAFSRELPAEYRFLTANGSVEFHVAIGQAEDVIFFPLWTGIPDDAGGYWFTGGPSPAGWDMWGMLCTDPVRMNDSWWACGLSEEGGKLPRLDSNQ